MLRQVQEPHDCVYTFDQLVNKLNEVLQDPTANSLHTFYLRSAIKWYSKNCNKFNKYLSL